MEDYVQVSELHFITHPGHALERDIYEDESPTAPLNLRKEDYFRYWHELGSLVKKHGQSDDTMVVVLYDGADTDYQEFIDEDHVDAEIETEGWFTTNGTPLEAGEGKIEAALEALEGDGRTTVSGELYGLCTGQFEEYLEEEYGVDAEKGVTFPRRELDRTNGSVHWADRKPAWTAMNKF